MFIAEVSRAGLQAKLDPGLKQWSSQSLHVPDWPRLPLNQSQWLQRSCVLIGRGLGFVGWGFTPAPWT